MKLDLLGQKNFLAVSFLLFVVSYTYSILTPFHTIMLGNDFSVGLLVSALTGIGIFFGLFVVRGEKVGFSTLTWVSLALLILFQPIFQNIIYPDSLIFSVGLLFLTALMSVLAVNFPEKKKTLVIQGIAWLLLVTGILSACTQIIQFFNPTGINGLIAFLPPFSYRFGGNISQPNIASFVNVLAIISASYLFFLNQKSKQRLFWVMLAVCLLAFGISLSASRAGLVLLMVAIFGSIFYPWISHRIRVSFLVFLVVSCVVGYQVGVGFLQSLQSAQALDSGVNRLLSDGLGLRSILLERAWWAFGSSPILGIGYGNYLAFGLENIERMAWFEPANHAHNIIAQIIAELGLVGLITTVGVVFVLCQKAVSFAKRQLPADEFFLCLLLAIIVLYSLSEFPLWYPNFLLIFAFMVGLLDKGFVLKKPVPHKILLMLACMIAVSASIYTGLYRKYLYNYEIVMYADVDNQQKIDAYQSFPNIFGFTKAKELMLLTVIDEENNDPNRLIPIGNRLIHATANMRITVMQFKFLAQEGRQEEADKLTKRVCVWEYQKSQSCNETLEHITMLDPEDKMGYTRRFNDWYQQRYGDK